MDLIQEIWSLEIDLFSNVSTAMSEIDDDNVICHKEDIISKV